ncbi:MAG: FAD-binding oxidoreductase [Polyangiaceae bacterium]
MARITFEGKRYPVRDDESALEALLRGGANVTFSCRKGSCHACALKAVSTGKGETDAPALANALGARAQRGLTSELTDRGYFLPCCSHPVEDVYVERPHPEELFVRARVEKKEMVSSDVVRVFLEPERTMRWRGGQSVQLRRPSDGVMRTFSIACLEEDYFIELHVKRIEGGALSPWIWGELSPGDVVEIQGPAGDCIYDDSEPDAPILVVGTGTGIAPLLGVVREAVRAGHRGPIRVHYGARTLDGLYAAGTLRALAAAHPTVEVCLSVSRPEGALPPDVREGRASDLAFADAVDLEPAHVFLAGRPEMVHAARVRAVLAGARRRRIHADPFEPATPFFPNDAEKIAGIPADLDLWRALEEGPGLTRLLEDFYTRAFADARLAPFFHKVTKTRAIEKQYEFLKDLFSGSRTYFGLRPFNAHHWMVISDELFDYREAMFEDCLIRYGLTHDQIRRWNALHEMFRREIVKAKARGLILQGVEQPILGVREETIEVGTLCDGCEAEMPAGSRGLLHERTGELFCTGCSARHVGQSLAPPAIA